MKPRIGITSSFHLSEPPRAVLNFEYVRSVALAGGTPFVLPSCESALDVIEYLDSLDGLLLSGGGDVAPRNYGEEPLPGLGLVSGERDVIELALLGEALLRGMPVFGICRGFQVINAGLGGSLYQDIPSQRPGSISHNPPPGQPRSGLWHSMTALPTARLAPLAAAGEAISVNSFHHQGVKELSRELEATATASDGLVEAFEGRGRGGWLVGVQFHPESLTPDHDFATDLFRAHVKAAGEWAARRA